MKSWSGFFNWATGAAAFLILAILLVIIGNIVWAGAGGLSWRFITTGTEAGMFDPATTGVLPMTPESDAIS